MNGLRQVEYLQAEFTVRLTIYVESDIDLLREWAWQRLRGLLCKWHIMQTEFIQLRASYVFEWHGQVGVGRRQSERQALQVLAQQRNGFEVILGQLLNVGQWQVPQISQKRESEMTRVKYWHFTLINLKALHTRSVSCNSVPNGVALN